MSEGLTYYVLDSETSGLSVVMHEICEYSIIRCSDRTQLSRQVKVDKPHNASYDALVITGKTIEDLSKGIGKLQAIEDFNNFLAQDGLTPTHRCLCAHNSSFDRRFFHQLWKQYDIDFPADYWLDTIPLCKRLATKMGQPKAKTKLDAAMDLFGIKKLAGFHTAQGDARNTYYLWKHLMEADIEYIDLIKPFVQRKTEPVSDEDMADFE